MVVEMVVVVVVSTFHSLSLSVGRVSQQDQILYQTERYHTATFGYDMPVRGDGDYLLILKFSEVRCSSYHRVFLTQQSSFLRFTSMLQT